MGGGCGGWGRLAAGGPEPPNQRITRETKLAGARVRAPNARRSRGLRDDDQETTALADAASPRATSEIENALDGRKLDAQPADRRPRERNTYATRAPMYVRVWEQFAYPAVTNRSLRKRRFSLYDT